ncbi:FAD/NAD(P)-binding domain-containing protein [Eremomyces bilateralis CBS 781.70]|uniref:FAD/NAD(P)-binding domain-containing protein n=1 Tax=Eremomyces bilateralis CBS 781.70 TaxID=1392243 RepID=A0A6G1GDW7_9PEZI|nr:FAD/NAD(P)-binding domain-containing protein [Eremomyces bilateralis CBS 781.70]KAF1816287.1 FAD/NAD(P)-binding domain-containing protein [Eremomyces bilateralis CBS 781.70]
MSRAPYDAVIIGSGQSGNPLAKAFADTGRKTALIEKADIGGTCVNWGCTPTKTMIASGRAAYLARRGANYGVNAGKNVNSDVLVDMERVRERKRDIVASFSGGNESRLLEAGVDVLKGEARFTGPKSLTVRMNDGGDKEVTSDLIFINVGERPSRPDLSGIDSIPPERVLDSTTIMELGSVPEHLIVLGGGYIGLEFGQLFRRFGSKITIIQRAERLIPREDPDVSKCMLDILEEDGTCVYLSSQPNSISRTKNEALPVSLSIKFTDGRTKTIEGSHLLLAAGRTPNTDTLNLTAAGVTTSPRGHVLVHDDLSTHVPGIFAIGDAKGGPAFTHISYDDFRIIRSNHIPSAMSPTARRLSTTKVSSSRRLTPYVIYTDPQVGHVGIHASDATTAPYQNRKVKTASMPAEYVARGLETDETRGMLKATVDADTGEILGFTAVCTEGGELMAVVQTAMMGGLKYWDLQEAVWAHPSWAESLNNLWASLE